MTAKQPKPLFDNLHWIARDQHNHFVDAYLVTLGVEEIKREYELAKRFLYSYRGSEDTFTSYRREIERLCQWAWVIIQKPLRKIDRHDIEAYFEFVQHPPKSWIADKHSQRFHTDVLGNRVPSEDWRPFLIRQRHKDQSPQRQQLSQAALRAIIAGTSTFFTYLQQENYVDKNPVLLIRQKNQIVQKQHHDRIIRKLSDGQWNQLIQTLLQQCEKDPAYERHLFIFSAFYLIGLRISELADTRHHYPIMSDFYVDSHKLWWFRSIGKGNKFREIAICDQMIKQLIRYRQYLGLSGLPNSNDSTPIIKKLKGEGGIGVRGLRKVVQSGFDLTINEMLASGNKDDAENMRAATVHWLRHTAISKDVQYRPREHVRDDAGHQSVQVTDRYIEVDLHARHATARGKKLINSPGDT